MRLKFTKMHGLGNDFMVVDGVTQKIFFSRELIKKLGDRHFGVGFDQLLLVEPPYDPELDFHYRIFNCDGSEVQMCGNGARCFVRFVTDHALTSKKEIKVSTLSGRLTLTLNDDGTVKVDMGSPVFEKKEIPLVTQQEQRPYSYERQGKIFKFSSLSMGNPHATFFVDEIKDEEFLAIGEELQHSPLYPQKVNVGFAKVQDDHQLDLRVYERGCKETLACGTGACAAAVAAIDLGLVQSPVKVNLPGGSLSIEYRQGGHVLMNGPAVTVYEGVIEI